MIKIKESADPRFKLGYIPQGWLDRALKRPDAINRKGATIFKTHNVKIVHGHEKADVGFSKHGDPVQGVPRNKCILFKAEPPIYNIYFGLKLNNHKYQKQFLATMSNTITDGLDEIHFNSPQKCFIEKHRFDNNKEKLLCMVLKNKNTSRIIASLIPGLRKYAKKSNAKIRIDVDNAMCKILGPASYDSYAWNGKSWVSSCFHGETENQFKTFSEHKFTIAFENSCFRGYVTEKPVQAMCCGSIPIYLGAPDVEYYLPKETYIDYRGMTPRTLVDKLLAMSGDEYFKRRLAMRKFIASEQANNFSSYIFAQKIAKILEEEL